MLRIVFLCCKGFALLLLVWAAIVAFSTGGIDRGFSDNPDFSWAGDVPGVNCTEHRIPVRLAPDGWREYTLVGQLCQTGDSGDSTLQVLVSGAGYGRVYWDFPYQPDTYSYARAALRAGDAIFNFDRLGMGLSDHPFGVLLNVDAQAYVLHQVLTELNRQYEFDAVTMLGHSFGSAVSLAHALQYPEQSDGVVLTGLLHSFNPAFGPAMGKSIAVAPFSGPVAGALFDPTYVITKPYGRDDVFYTRSNVDKGVLAADNATRETTAVGEMITMGTYPGEFSKELTVPVMILVGENDMIFCGGDLDCTDHKAVVENEMQYYPATSCPEIYVLDDTNHNANLHLNAPEAFALMQDWVSRRVGSGGNPPSQPCGGA